MPGEGAPGEAVMPWRLNRTALLAGVIDALSTSAMGVSPAHPWS
ncbi:hypothetical protein ACQEVX_16625 [Streptomyces syringium]